MSAVMGASVDPSQSLVEVADPSALDVVFNVTARRGARIPAATRVTVTAGEGAGGEALGEAMVTTVGAAVDSASRAVACARAASPARPLRTVNRCSGSRHGRARSGRERCRSRPWCRRATAIRSSWWTAPVCTRAARDARCAHRDVVEIVTGLAAGETVSRAALRRVRRRPHQSGRAPVKLFDLLSRRGDLCTSSVSLTSAAGCGRRCSCRRDLPELQFSASRWWPRARPRRTPGGLQHHAAIEEAVSHRPRCHARALAFDPRGGAAIQVTFAPRTDMAYALQAGPAAVTVRIARSST